MRSLILGSSLTVAIAVHSSSMRWLLLGAAVWAGDRPEKRTKRAPEKADARTPGVALGRCRGFEIDPTHSALPVVGWGRGPAFLLS
jgi:hypothetical protein